MNVKLVFLAGSWKLDALSFLEAHAFVFFSLSDTLSVAICHCEQSEAILNFLLTITGFPLQNEGRVSPIQ